MLEIRLFGGVRFRVSGASTASPRSGPAQKLLAYLALNRGKPLSRPEAARRIWGKPEATDSLRGALRDLRAEIRKAGGDPDSYIATVGGVRGREGELELLEGRTWVDAVDFARLLAEGKPAEALELVEGELLAGMRDPGPHLEQHRRSFHRQIADTHTNVARRQWEGGDRAGAISTMEHCCRFAPDDEVPHWELIRYLALDGRIGRAQEVGRHYLSSRSGARIASIQALLDEINRGELKPASPLPSAAVREPMLPTPATVGPPAPGTGRKRRRGLVAVALALATVCVLGVVVVLSFSGDDGARGCGSGAATLATADQRVAGDGPSFDDPLRPEKPVDVGSRPDVVAPATEGIWVGESQGIALIDPATERQSGNALPTESGVYALAVAEDRIWAVLRNGTLVSFDRGTRELVGEPLAFGDVGGADVALGDGAVWVNNYGVERFDGYITRVDPCTAEMRRYQIGRSAVTVKYGFGSIWVSDPTNGVVARVDPESGSVQTIPGFSDPEDLLVTDDSVWVVQYAKQTIVRIDPNGNRIAGKPIRVGPDPGGIAYGDDSIWLPLYGNGSVTRVDPNTGRSQVGAVKSGPSPTDAAVAFGRVWVPNNGGDTVTPIGAAR